MRAVATGTKFRQLYLCAPYNTMTVTCIGSIVLLTVCSWSSSNRLNLHNSYFILPFPFEDLLLVILLL